MCILSGIAQKEKVRSALPARCWTSWGFPSLLVVLLTVSVGCQDLQQLAHPLGGTSEAKHIPSEDRTAAVTFEEVRYLQMVWTIVAIAAPFVTVVACEESKMVDAIGPTLVCTAITCQPEFRRRLLDAVHVDRLNLGAVPTVQLNWRQPHEGNLIDFLFRARAFQMAEL